MHDPVILVLNQPSAERPSADGRRGVTRLAAGAPLVTVHDLGVTRGDGIFETINVAEGRVQALEAHLDRFAASARLLDLPAPDLDEWRDAVRAAVSTHPPVAEAFVKTVLTRGVEGEDRPTGWLVMQQSADFTRPRTVGISVVLLDRGYRSDVATTSPWLLQGAKTLSYAINRAAVREAARRGADDVVFVSSDGLLLEGPTASLVIRRGATLLSPPPSVGILPGTTQADLFALAPSLGLEGRLEELHPADLAAADAAWLVSSARNAAPIRAVDGVDRVVDRELTDRMNAALFARAS